MVTKDDRIYAGFPIEMDEHPKIIGLSDAAFRAMFEAVFYARRMENDGFLDERVVVKRWGLDVVGELTANDPEKPSWIRVDSPRPGWQIHDYLKHHPSKAEITEKRSRLSKQRSEAGSAGAAKRWQTDGKTDGKTMANDNKQSQSQEQSQEHLTMTYVGQSSYVSNRARTAQDVDTNLTTVAKADGIDVAKVRAQLEKRLGIVTTLHGAASFIYGLTDKARSRVQNPTGYAIRAINTNGDEVHATFNNGEVPDTPPTFGGVGDE